MNKETLEHAMMELRIAAELQRKGELDFYDCGDISKMAEERCKADAQRQGIGDTP